MVHMSRFKSLRCVCEQGAFSVDNFVSNYPNMLPRAAARLSCAHALIN